MLRDVEEKEEEEAAEGRKKSIPRYFKINDLHLTVDRSAMLEGIYEETKSLRT